MARSGAIEIPIAVDTGGVEKSIQNGLIEPIQDAEKALERLGDVDAGKDLAKDLDKAQDATKRLDTELEQTRKELSKLGYAGKEAGRDVKAGLDEAKDEAKSSGKEAAASFSGGFDDVADFLQETLANAFGGFGPLGAAAGIAAAAALGAAMAGAQAAQERLAEARQAAGDLANTLYENKGQLPIEDAIQNLLDILPTERKASNMFESLADGFVDLGTNIDAVKTAAKFAKTPVDRFIEGLSGADLDATQDALEAVDEAIRSVREKAKGELNWENGAAIAQLEALRGQLEGVKTTAEVADDILGAVGSSLDTQAYVEKVDAIGQAWQDAATDAGDYISEQDGVTTFDWSKYLTDAETTLAAANDYKRKIVTLPDEIRNEAETIFAEQGAVAANSYTDAFIGASAADKSRFTAAAKANGASAGKAAGESLAAETEAAAKAKAQGWGPMKMPVTFTVDDTAVRNWKPPVKTGQARYAAQAV